MKDFREEIEEARAKVAHYRIRAERPGSRLEDDYALEKARTRLLTLELREAKLGRESGRLHRDAPADRPGRGRLANVSGNRTNSEQIRVTARERAEAAFADLKQGSLDKGRRG
ncbi:MAG: hypothetical protein Tsb0019_29220 [Roseibium sp.]